MNENKRLRLWQWMVVLLVLCNVGLMLFIWTGRAHEGPPGRETPRDYVIRNLQFTDDQVKKYDVLIQDHQHAMRDLRDEAAQYRTALFGSLKEEYKSNDVTDSLTRLIATAQKEIEIVTYNHFVQVRTICTEAQKPEFDKIIGDVIKKMNRGPHPPPGGHGGPPPGDHEGGHPPPPPESVNP